METKEKYGLIGKTLSHSFSKKYFTHKFDKQSINANYLNFELNDISEIESVFATPLLKGLNVTIPYKESVIDYLDELSGEAKEIGAVNTIQFKNGKHIGHNTDVFGFKQMIKPFFKSRHERAVVLGTGGAAKAVKYVLEELGCNVILISREPNQPDQFSYEDVTDVMLKYHLLVVNTTPVGMYPNVDQCPNIPYEFLTPEHLVIDLIYNPEKTLFLQNAQKQGVVILNGQTMLEQQAEKSWEIWNE
ncbi:shikimate dehydrogenase [Paracrocinitomix mangrovi]|uniref:shikimate dehydrogenase family protein n=1 Tax=Paracrocinitomix mangrovi TaxID=2862509 RepID=UPI001C8DE0AC|nr:shikimate dehydrogenase [Paracrocinitomix mangrovi]UKN02426.1 shikimate dehydrogenase [Paracrocinitomix mangrovi]